MKTKRWREGCGRPCGYRRRVFCMLMWAGVRTSLCRLLCGGAAAESRTSLERPCRVSKPRACLKARAVWRSPQLGSSWIKDGSEVSIWKAMCTEEPHTCLLQLIQTSRCFLRRKQLATHFVMSESNKLFQLQPGVGTYVRLFSGLSATLI